MEAVRRYVFPIVWMILVAIIAASLARLAFFDTEATGAVDEGAEPTANVDPFATAAVERADITSTLDLPGTVRPDTGTTVQATRAGEITAVFVTNGEQVTSGERILQVRVPREQVVAPEPAGGSGDAAGDAKEVTDSAGASDAAAAVAPTTEQYTFHDLTAGGAGTVRDLKALTGQMLSIGDQVATLSPGTYSVVAQITPEQQLELLDRDVEATVQLPTSASPIECATSAIVEDDGEEGTDTPEAAPQIDPMTGMPMEAGTASVAELRCAIPPDTRIVPGLSVTMTVDLGTATDVLTVPTTAVEGTGAAGAVYVLDDVGGEPTRQEVTLGLRGDGVVEVSSGLEEGQEILQFAPGVDNPEDPFMEEFEMLGTGPVGGATAAGTGA